eukprot:scaffold42008_cov34-Tisochrysis_lutea.AAC.1
MRSRPERSSHSPDLAGSPPPLRALLHHPGRPLRAHPQMHSERPVPCPAPPRRERRRVPACPGQSVMPASALRRFCPLCPGSAGISWRGSHAHAAAHAAATPSQGAACAGGRAARARVGEAA